MKNHISVTSCILFCIAALTGCGESASNDQATVAKSAAPAPVATQFSAPDIEFVSRVNGLAVAECKQVSSYTVKCLGENTGNSRLGDRWRLNKFDKDGIGLGIAYAVGFDPEPGQKAWFELTVDEKDGLRKLEAVYW